MNLYATQKKTKAKRNDYNPLLKVITEKDYYYDENLKFPSLKEFAILADVKYDKARRQFVNSNCLLSQRQFTSPVLFSSR